MAILVTGGAGYVGSHIVRELQQQGEAVVVVDDLSNGHRRAIGEARFVQGDFADPAALELAAEIEPIEILVHMAAFCEVGESMKRPDLYYRNNVMRSLDMLETARRLGVSGLVFSSSAAVYGDPLELPIVEDHRKAPTNPYGETKLVFERVLDWYHGAFGIRSVALRYFNAAGAHPDGDIGEDHDPESHIVPRLLRSAREQGEPTPIFGSDYPTRDGTCVRDYVHVVDLARAHVLAISAMRAGGVGHAAVNLGNQEGFTVLEVVDAVERVVGRRPPTVAAPRRAGDPAHLVASAERARELLGWEARFPELDSIVGTAWNWHRAHPEGFGVNG